MTRLSTDDWVAISDLLGDYCWKVDEGDGDAWIALWTKDGVFTGIRPEPVVGHAQLRTVPIDAYAGSDGGKLRHSISNLTCRYGESRDVVKARVYNYVTRWGDAHPVRSLLLALCKITLVRAGDGWLIQRNDAVILN